ncbi:acyl-CoA dehydrogenase family protein [Peribacillus sp. NPDC058002]|uniref:acyl-CoA dehydrogenase family protein n=1 Tax=Peribacillus sp. NPDC058002 TaxID=3346301 RepID=UPI0036DA9FD3
MIELFIKTYKQRNWLRRLENVKKDIIKSSNDVDQLARFPIESFQLLKDIGYTKITLPAEYGGEGLSVYDMVLLQETLASYDENTSLAMGWTLGVIGDLYANKLWSANLLEEFSEQIIGGAIVNRLVSEAITGSPTRGGRPGTNARRTTNGWVINGRKSFSTASPVLDYFLTSAWIEEKQQVGFFLIQRNTPGISIDETWDVMAMRGTGSHDVIFEEVLVDEKYLVETPQRPSGGLINGWQLHIPATYLGIAQAARDYAVHFSVHHQPNSLQAPISTLPHVQHLIGEIELHLQKSRFVLYGVAENFDDPIRRQLLTNEIAIAKYVVTNNALEIIDKAMRIVGAKSLQNTNPLQRYYRNVRAGLHNPPMDDMTITKLAQHAIENNK